MSENNNAFSGAAPGSAEERRRARARRRLLALCVGCAVLVVLTAGILLLSAFNARRAAEEEAAANAGPSVPVNVLPESGTVDSFSFTAADGQTVSLRLKGDLWMLEGDPACPVNTAAVQTLYGRLLTLKAYQSFTPEEELSGYGLDAPVLTITLADTASGAARTLKLGALNEASTYYYLSNGEEGTLYTVSDELYAAFFIKLTDLLLPESLPTFTSNDITAVTVAAPGAQPLYLTPTQEQQNGVTLWQAVQGEETALVDAATGVTILDRLASLSYNSMAAWAPDDAVLAAMELDEAQCTAITVEYTTTDEAGVSVSDSLTLYVGDTDAETGGRYAYAAGHGGVYLVTAAKVEGLLDAVPADLAPLEDEVAA